MNEEVLEYVMEAIKVISGDEVVKSIRDYLIVLENGINDGEMIECAFPFPKYQNFKGKVLKYKFPEGRLDELLQPVINVAVGIPSVKDYVINKLMNVYLDRPVREIKSSLIAILNPVFNTLGLEKINNLVLLGDSDG